MNTRTRAIAIAKRWLVRSDINPTGELKLVAQALIDEVNSRQDDAVVGVVELPPWPFDREVEA